jgi:hypothetical protein
MKEIENIEDELSKKDEQLNGLQIAFLMRKKFAIDFNEGAVITEREIHDLRLDKDNVPAYLNKWDSLHLSLQTTISPATKEVIFAREIEKSTQLAEIYKKYSYDCAKGKIKRTYEYLREEIDLHLKIEKRLKNIKSMRGGKDGYALAANGKGSTPCRQWATAGSCMQPSRERHLSLHSRQERKRQRKERRR